MKILKNLTEFVQEKAREVLQIYLLAAEYSW